MSILTADQAAELLGCTRKTIEDRARAGDLPGLLWGDGGWRFPAEAFTARVNALALEQAQKRREAKQPRAVAQPAQPEQRKAPPALPARRAWKAHAG